MSVETRQALFRDRDGEDSARVTEIELFYDLVFVFAVTQLSHSLVDHLTVRGALETLVLFLAVWWLWIYTSWATNWLNPERGAVRGMLMAMMLGGLVLASVIPTAFRTNGAVFVAAYLTMQLGRTLWIAWLARGHNHARVRNFLRIAFYFLLATPLWIGGVLADRDMRLVLWAAALVVEYSGPSWFFRTPWLGQSSVSDWDISGSHMAERCALFIIIALGEAILVTGATFTRLDPGPAVITAFAVSLVGSAAMWWIYFDVGAKRGGEAIEHEADAGRLARNAYTYLHMPIVAGIVVAAVADEMLLAHPVGHHAEPDFILVVCGGPLLFLVGNQVFKWMTADRPMPPLSHFIGSGLLVAVGIGGWVAHLDPLTIGALASAALIITAVWEWFSLNGGWQRWTPWLGRRTAIALEDSER